MPSMLKRVLLLLATAPHAALVAYVQIYSPAMDTSLGEAWSELASFSRVWLFVFLAVLAWWLIVPLRRMGSTVWEAAVLLLAGTALAARVTDLIRDQHSTAIYVVTGVLAVGWLLQLIPSKSHPARRADL